MKRILILGATSAIAMACARQWAKEKACFFLVGRDSDKLEQITHDLLARGASSVHYELLDMNTFDQHAAIVDKAWQTLSAIDVCLIAHGTLPDQTACEQNPTLTLKEISTNGLSVIAFLTLLANKMAEQKRGTLAVITSVAGDRGRPSNYVYGAAKAAVIAFCQGLQARLYKQGIQVLIIKPGFVATPMTQGLALPGLLVVQPERVAQDILSSIDKQKKTLYTPWFWRYIMQIIRMIPNAIFVRLKL